MEVGKRSCILIVIVFVANFNEIEGHDFFTDFVKCFNIENPVFITTDALDQEFKQIRANATTTLIRYTTNKDEEEIANFLLKLHLIGEVTMTVFLDNGHQKLLNLLINDLELLKKGMTWLLSEADVTPSLNLTLRFDTELYMYTSKRETINLKEMYAVNRKVQIKNIGTWRESMGLSIPTTNIWERRTNMRGMTIRVATLSLPLLHELHYDKLGTTIIGGSGFFFEPLIILAKQLNFTLKLMPSIDGQWGAVNSNGTWNGIIGMLQKEQADIAGAGLVVTNERGAVVTFSRTIAREEMKLASAPTMGPKSQPWIYLEIFPHSVWYFNCAVVISVSTCFFIVNHSGINYMHDTLDSEKFTMLNGLGLSLTFFRQIYYNVKINCKSTKILFVLAAFSGYLLHVHYTAYLTAATSTVKDSPIESFGDVLSGGYQVSVLGNSAYHDMLESAKLGTSMNEVYQKTMKNRPGALLKSYTEVKETIFSKKDLYFEGDLYLKASLDGLIFYRLQGILYVNLTYITYIIE